MRGKFRLLPGGGGGEIGLLVNLPRPFAMLVLTEPVDAGEEAFRTLQRFRRRTARLLQPDVGDREPEVFPRLVDKEFQATNLLRIQVVSSGETIEGIFQSNCLHPLPGQRSIGDPHPEGGGFADCECDSSSQAPLIIVAGGVVDLKTDLDRIRREVGKIHRHDPVTGDVEKLSVLRIQVDTGPAHRFAVPFRNLDQNPLPVSPGAAVSGIAQMARTGSGDIEERLCRRNDKSQKAGAYKK